MSRMTDLLFSVSCKRSALERAQDCLDAAVDALAVAEEAVADALAVAGVREVYWHGELWALDDDDVLTCRAVPDAYSVVIPPDDDDDDDDEACVETTHQAVS